MPSTPEEQTIRFLRGEENPFDAIVVPDRPGSQVVEFHVPAVHRDEFDRLCGVLDKYRNPDYPNHGQPHGTRLVTIRGVRGSGKTHLMHVLECREMETPELWVRPRYYAASFAFPEYVLSELVRSLLSQESEESAARLRWCSEAITRRLLFEAIAPLDAFQWVEWVRAASQGRNSAWRRGGRWAASRDRILDDLGIDGDAAPVVETCRRHGLPVDAVRFLVADHIDRTTPGNTSAARMKRESLMAFVEPALSRRCDRLCELFEHDFAEAEESLPPSRPEMVLALLETLVEMLSSVRVPVVFAFDNVERLLAPRGSIDLGAAQSFFSGMAHLMDQSRGILALLFVETGLWNQLTAAIDRFVEQRLRQGVRVKDFGCIWDLELKPPTAAQIGEVVRQRMAPLRVRMPDGAPLDPEFPFGPDDAKTIVSENVDVLRTALLRLRDRYDEIVLPRGQQLPQSPTPANEIPPAPASGGMVLDWDTALAQGRRRLQALRRTALSHELHLGLARWLETLVGFDTGNWRLKSVAPAVAYGTHPTFGLVTIAEWQAASGRICRVAIGPVLGEGRSMPIDLGIKLALFRERPAMAEQLLVLWPVLQGKVDVSQLPPATQQVWNEGAAGRDVFLRNLPMADFAWLISFPEWLATHLDSSNVESLYEFVRRQTSHFIDDCSPKLENEVGA